MRITKMKPDGSFTMQIPTKFMPKEYFEAIGVRDPEQEKKDVRDELAAIRKAVSRPATVLPEVAEFLDRHARKLEEKLRIMEGRKV